MSQISEPTNLGAPRVCSIADALDILCERWTLHVLREIGFGVHRFKDIQANTGAPDETLSVRLRKLRENGLVERRRYSERPPRDEYVLTPASTDLSPVLAALREWGERYVTPVDGTLSEPRVCFISDALDIVCERWTLHALREISFGVHRFKDIQTNTGAPRETLTLRLRKLETAGLIERRQYSERPPRDEYVLTTAGRDLKPVLGALRVWGERYATPLRRAS
ncbi:winged helix-turn-helix transcriptional regulator [Streptomyces sp. NPDC058653]|uniref:winged helix-turn-helix transcriptional regulator n=1 Tax=Streptomyces sp. NPDC058653 TaxID=3346576 RepID=UPI00366416E4